MSTSRNSILIADDSSLVVKLIVEILTRSFPGSTLLTAATGTACIEVATQELPDILLLDVKLPDIDGLEVCRRLKADERTRHIPILLVTGEANSGGGRLAGLEMGADAYLFKPFQNDELAAQVKVMLRIKRVEDSLRGQKASLERTVREQTVEIEHSRRELQFKVRILEGLLESKTKAVIEKDHAASDRLLTMGIAHEINNPNAFISSNLQTFARFWELVDRALDKNAALSAAELQQLEFVRKEMPALVSGMRKGTERISSIIWHMRNYAGDIMANARILDVARLVESALEMASIQLPPTIKVSKKIPKALPKIYGSEQMLCQVLVNLLTNAAHAINESGQPGTITVRARREAEDEIVIEVSDTGPGIDGKDLERLFDPFFTTRRGKGGTGLGLFFGHGIIKGHKGVLTAASEPGKGATLAIRLPAVDVESRRSVAAAADGRSLENASTP